MTGYVKELVILMISQKAEGAAQEIDVPYDSGIDDQIYWTVFHQFDLKNTCSVDTIEDAVNRSIRHWQKATKGKN